MNRAIFVITLSLLMLGGCVTPPKSKQILLINQNRLHNQSLFKPSELRTIPVKITRDVGFKGGMQSAYLKIDGQYVVWFNTAEQITLYLEPNGYIFEVVSSDCPDYSYCISNVLDVTIKSGLVNNFRITLDNGFSIKREST